MRIRTLIATADRTYASHISDYISEYHADTMEISVCNTVEQLLKAQHARRYDVALMDASLIEQADLGAVGLALLLWANAKGGGAADAASVPSGARCIRKHRRISSTISDILEQYAAVAEDMQITCGLAGSVTAVWSPSGGVGKTTVALAYAASKAIREKEVFYLNLESFAATSAYFKGQGKSISAVFEMLEGGGGNVKMLVQGISGSENGIRYLCAPDNFDDICILSPDNIRELVNCCAGTANELVIDLSCTCDLGTRQVFELADEILLVTDRSATAEIKLSQFISQSNVYEGIRDKTRLVVNKHRATDDTAKNAEAAGAFSKPGVVLPFIQGTSEQFVYKALAKCDFREE